MHPRNVVIVNERAFQRLPEAVRQTLLRVSTESREPRVADGRAGGERNRARAAAATA
jgi:TRAP-type C4-dicarboxylate transport system substrate-binding protein